MICKKKRAMRHGTKKPRSLKVIRNTDPMIDINKYLSVLSGSKSSDKICETELNENALNRIPNIWIRQACVQGFDCETIT